MPNRPVDKVYVTYKRKCKEINVSPVEKKEFEATFSKQKRIITYMTDVLHRKTPHVISEINKDMVLYTGVTGGQAIINVWTPIECEALTGVKQ
jgi:hypothetical protein